MKLIDKDTLGAEIERRIDEVSQIGKASYEIGLCDAYKIVLRFLDTLEVKEVDLEKEILDYIGDEDTCKNGKWNWYECNNMIRHFFELGVSINSKLSDVINLEEEIKKYLDEQPVITKSKGINYKLVPSAEVIAKHFFELGLKAKRETTEETEWNEARSIKPPFTSTLDGNKYSNPMLCYDKFGNYYIAQYVRWHTGHCGWFSGEDEVTITHWKELQ